jgi:hypothetical protein
MKGSIRFVLILTAIAAFLLYSLWFGWPGINVGWSRPGDPLPLWFPTVSGGLVTVTMALFAFWLMRRWKA